MRLARLPVPDWLWCKNLEAEAALALAGGSEWEVCDVGETTRSLKKQSGGTLCLLFFSFFLYSRLVILGLNSTAANPPVLGTCGLSCSAV